ncbi:iron chelate uptake ABC transporter family permease subunit [Nesterenkonia muleiensis]|uniref:iron chelate uptake ABC transporter family permease subunit n=1 Tax=Nesterenkonia muleiensis TaxID=2282648 RepID=UPI000E74F33A
MFKTAERDFPDSPPPEPRSPGASAAGPAQADRRSGPITDRRHMRRYILIMTALGLLAVGVTFGIMTWDNPGETGTRPWWLIVAMRRDSLITIAVVAVCHAVATVAFQTAVNNRILTPGIMGFGSLYTAIQTTAVFLLGVGSATALVGVGPFLMQMAAMVVLATILYTWLLSGRFSNIHIMLLVGVVIGGVLGSLSNFMQRMLTPSEFDVLQARLFGNISNARADYLPYAIPIVLVVVALLWLRANTLNVIALGRTTAQNLGVAYRRELIIIMALVSVLVATATALVGPMMFLGFLAAILAYQFSDTYSHRMLFPMAVLFGYTILAGSYFMLRHIWDAGGAVTIIVELIGGLVFLIVLMRKGRL